MVAKFLLFTAFVCITALEVAEGIELSCLSDDFHCLNGKCIRRIWYCDNDNDCGDGSDESHCSVTLWYGGGCPNYNGSPWLHCGDGDRCIPREWKCDGYVDCSDGLDEANCGYPIVVSTPATSEEEGVEESKFGDTAVDSLPGVPSATSNMVQMFLEARQNISSVSKWGPQLPKIALALFLSDFKFFAPGNVTGSEIAYELSLQLLPKLGQMKQISTQELELFINALTVSCIDPKDFFGTDLVAELRARANNGTYANPFTYLTLCNAGDFMSETDVQKLHSIFDAHHRPLWTDIQALAIMAMACIRTRSNLDVDEGTFVRNAVGLKRNLRKNGNIRTTAIVLQALMSADKYPRDFDLAQTVKVILQETTSSPNISFPDLYYFLPLLNSRSLLNINSDHCIRPITSEVEMVKKLGEHAKDRVQVRVSAFVGEERDLVRKWQLKVPADYSFYKVLQSVGSLDPAFAVHFGFSGENKPYVAGLFKFFDDSVKDMHWFIYSKSGKGTTQPRLLKESPVDIQLKKDEEMILWYKSGEGKDPQ